MIRKFKKKAFTLVELLVVIAILAILATVSIVGYGAFTKKAKESNDIYLVKQMNIVLDASKVVDGKNKTMTDALDDVFDKGYDLTKLTPTSSKYNIVWDSVNDQMVLLNDFKEVVFPNENVSDKKDLYVIVSNENEINEIYKDFSFYLRDNFNNNQEVSLSINNGIDVGKNENIISISYNNLTKHTVSIRTNGGTLSINAANDTINHFGWVKELNISAVATNDCYHEYGFVGSLKTFTSGKLVTYEGSQFHQSKEEVETIIGTNQKNIERAKFNEHKYDENGVCYICNTASSTLHEHTFVYTDNNDKSTHSVTCKNCNYSVAEPHNNVNGKCDLCGYEFPKSVSVSFSSGKELMKQISEKIIAEDGNYEKEVKTIIFGYTNSYQNEINDLNSYSVTSQDNLEIASLYWNENSGTIYILSNNLITAPENLNEMFAFNAYKDWTQIYKNVENIFLLNFGLVDDVNYKFSNMFMFLSKLNHIYVSERNQDWSVYNSDLSSSPYSTIAYECPCIFENYNDVLGMKAYAGVKDGKKGAFSLINGIKFEPKNVRLKSELDTNGKETGNVTLFTINGADVNYADYTYEFITEFSYTIEGNYTSKGNEILGIAKFTYVQTATLNNIASFRYIGEAKSTNTSGNKENFDAEITNNKTNTIENKKLELVVKNENGYYRVDFNNPSAAISGANNRSNPASIKYTLNIKKDNVIVAVITCELINTSSERLIENLSQSVAIE